MRNTVFKSIVITISAIVGSFCIVFLVLFLGFPKTLGQINSQLGQHLAAVKFYEKAYNRSGDFDTLHTLIDEAEKTESDYIAYLYGDKFIFDSQFDEYCALSDENNKTSLSTSDYYCGIIIKSIMAYKSNDSEILKDANNKIIDISFKKTFVYDDACPLKLTIMLVRKNSDKQLAKKIVERYDSSDEHVDDEWLFDDINQLRSI